MNFNVIRNLIGKILVLIGLLMIVPLVTALIYRETIKNIISYLIPMGGLIGIGLLLGYVKPAKDTRMGAKEGFVIVSLSWLLMSLFGCIPGSFCSPDTVCIECDYQCRTCFDKTYMNCKSCYSIAIYPYWLYDHQFSKGTQCIFEFYHEIFQSVIYLKHLASTLNNSCLPIVLITVPSSNVHLSY